VGVGYRKNEGAEMTRKHNSPMNQYEVKLCLAICDQSQFQAILALEFNGYFTRIQMFDAKNQEKRTWLADVHGSRSILLHSTSTASTQRIDTISSCLLAPAYAGQHPLL